MWQNLCALIRTFLFVFSAIVLTAGPVPGGLPAPPPQAAAQRMGDHFNLLIRPVLWRELKVGSRIVSHRFGMGDWPPDETITAGDGGFYELHLWTITEEIRRTLDAR